MKRYNLAMPDELFAELQLAADARNTTVVTLLRQFTKLGLLALSLEGKPNAALLVREGEAERELIIL